MRSGQRSYIPGIGYIRVTSVKPVDIDSLTDADAIPDGFPTAAALQHELNTNYGDKLAQGHKACRIVFHCEPEEKRKGRESRVESRSKSSIASRRYFVPSTTAIAQYAKISFIA